MSSICAKLGVADRLQAALLAQEAGLADAPLHRLGRAPLRVA